MPTCRDVIHDALRALKAAAPGEDGHVDQLNAGLRACQDLLLELHEARGPLTDIDVNGTAWIANENTRVRIGAGSSVTVTLPNAVPMWPGAHVYDYGFVGSPWWNMQGSTDQADGVTWRAPTDGARIEIVGTGSGTSLGDLFFYRADLNRWLPVYGVRLDDELPLNQRYRGPFAALAAERAADELCLEPPNGWLARRIALARTTLFTRPGDHHPPTRAEFF